MGYTRFDGLQSVGKKIIDTLIPEFVDTAAAVTFTAAQIFAGLILRDPNGAARADLMPTAVDLIAQLGDRARKTSPYSTGFEFSIRNAADLAETITLTTNTGITLSGTMTIAQGQTRRFLLVFEAAPNTVTVYSLGSSAH